MNKIIITFLFLVGITASSCTTSKSVVSQNVDLSKYEYASIINNDTYHIPAQLMEYEIQLFDAVEGSRLKLINDMRINELTATQQSKLLMVKYGVDVLEEKSIVTVNFIDYLTGRPAQRCGCAGRRQSSCLDSSGRRWYRSGRRWSQCGSCQGSAPGYK